MRGVKAKYKGKVKGVPPPDEGREKGNLLIRYLWTHETDIIHDMRVVNTDDVSYKSKDPDNCLETTEC